MGMKVRARDASGVWRVPVYLPYLQPPLAKKAIAAAEAELGVALPRTYLDLLGEQNGGYVRRRLPDSVHSMIWGIGPHFPSITGDWYVDLVDDEVWRPANVELMVPFDGDGHWYLCLDYRKGGARPEPAVTFIDVECENERPVAASFAAFLGKLETEPRPTTVGVVGEVSLKNAIKRLEQALKIVMERPSAFDHGYPVARARLAADPPEWLWISENEVPRGFARRSEPRYEELRSRLPGTALRFPAHPEVSVVVSSTESVFDRVLTACATAGLTIVRLKSD